jgi:hypothetical protein
VPRDWREREGRQGKIWVTREVFERFRELKRVLSERSGMRVSASSVLKLLMNCWEIVDRVGGGTGLGVDELREAAELYAKLKAFASLEGVQPREALERAIEAYGALKRIRGAVQRRVEAMRAVSEEVARRLSEVKK